jgi:hypothetical protein
MGGMPDELYLPSDLRLSSLLLTGWVRKLMKQKSRKIIRRFTDNSSTNWPFVSRLSHNCDDGMGVRVIPTSLKTSLGRIEVSN